MFSDSRLSAIVLPFLLLFTSLLGLPETAIAGDEEPFPTHAPPPELFPRLLEAPPVQKAPERTAAPQAAKPSAYMIQPGDVLTVSVWKESDLQSEAYVRPDGGMSFPLAGDIPAAGHSVEEVRGMIDKRLRRVISDPEVTVSVKQIGGNLIYVVGKVNKPGNFFLNGPIDVMQAISMAGGATPFAALNDIRIIRHDGPEQTSIPFHYHDIEKGRNLEQNIVLHSGDTVVVP
jgi:polysaccharide export outer membrane protein